MAKKKSSSALIVEKRNDLNSMVKSDLTVEELKMLSIYLSKINARDVGTRYVRFSFSELKSILGHDRIQVDDLSVVTDRLLQHIIYIPLQNGKGVEKFTLFSVCRMAKDNDGLWYVEIDANDKALPLMFNFKKEYFTYKLQNVVALKSSSQVRMYEILKQYEKLGQRELSVSELKSYLAIDEEEYSRWDNFKTRVLDSCQRALETYTDIKFTYRKGVSGTGGKWLTIVFDIMANSPEKGRVVLVNEPIDIDTPIVADEQVDTSPYSREQGALTVEDLSRLLKTDNSTFTPVF